MGHDRPAGLFIGADPISIRPQTAHSNGRQSSSPRPHFDKVKTVLVLDAHRLTCECLARLIGDHCPDLRVRIAELGEAARAGLSAYDPDLVIINCHDRPCFAADFPDSAGIPVIVIGEFEGDGGQSTFFPAHGDVGLLIAAVRLTLAGGRFVTPDAPRLDVRDQRIS